MLKHNSFFPAILSIVFSLCASALPAKPQSRAVDEILEKHIRALGEKTAVERVTTLVMKGTAEISAEGRQVTGTTERYVKFPNKMFVRFNFTAVKMTSGLDGRVGWKDLGSGVTSMNEWEVDFLKRNYLLFGPFTQVERFTSAYRSLKLRGPQRIDNRDAQVIEAEPWHGETETLYFDAATGLLYRWDLINESEKSQKNPQQLYVDEYSAVGGIMVPRSIRVVMAAATLRSTFTDIKINVAVDDAIFVKPQ